MKDEIIRLAVVDDSRIFRCFTEKAVNSLVVNTSLNVKVVASLWCGEKVLEYIRQNQVDLITLDVEMPGIDGLETLRLIQEHNRDTGADIGVIMLSGLTRAGATATMAALELGALDFISKPASDDPNAQETLYQQLLSKITCWSKTRETKITVNAGAPTAPTRKVAGASVLMSAETIPASSFAAYDLVCIGVSTGGPKALHQMLPEFCKKVTCPILIVQHMPVGFTESLAEGLNKKCRDYTVVEAGEDTVVDQKTIYIAPGGKHMVMRAKENRLTLGLHEQPPENGCRPSVDVLFRSVAQISAGRRVLSIVLTGMGVDGTAGLRPLKRAGARIIAQDEQSSVVWGMPGSAVATGLVDKVVDLMDIPHSAIELLS
ncbi:MAG: chemotaxis-specific protein-glutamate methyltransferase CheB [Fibrobacterales bacterium]